MGFVKLLALCLFMFLSSLAVGLLPLFFSLSPRHLRYVTTVGVGLLVGVAFIVIIPEGVHTYYRTEAADSHQHAAALPAAPELSNASASSSLLLRSVSNSRLGDVSMLGGEDEAEHVHIHAEKADAAHQQEALVAEPVDDADHEGGTDGEDDGHQHIHPGSQLQQRRGKRRAKQQQQHEHGRLLLQHTHAHDAEHQHELHREDQESVEEAGELAAAGDAQSPCLPAGRRGWLVGLSMVAGFVLMLLVDRLSGGHEHSHGGGREAAAARRLHLGASEQTQETLTAASSSPSSSPPVSSLLLLPASSTKPASPLQLPSSSSAPSSSGSPKAGPSPAVAAAPVSSPPPPSSSSSSSGLRHSNTALLGILTHSAIDGLALGAISVSENSSLELVVFLAIILHKGPAAFGLASFLLYQGRSRGEVRWLLTVFSLAAPVTSIATYLFFLQSAAIGRAAGSEGEGEAVSGEMLGLCLLFSAGTFLFTIAAHILPEVSRKEGGVMDWRHVGCLIAGILMPLTLSGQHHHH